MVDNCELLKKQRTLLDAHRSLDLGDISDRLGFYAMVCTVANRSHARNQNMFALSQNLKHQDAKPITVSKLTLDETNTR